MRRRTVLGALGGAIVPLGGCLSDDGTTDAQGSTDGGSYDGDVADLYEVHENGIPRGAGEPLLNRGEERLAYAVSSASEAERIFTQEDVADDARASNRQFLAETEFDHEVLLQVEEVVPESSYSIQLSDVGFRDGTMRISYEEVSDEEGTSMPRETVRRLLLRIDVGRVDVGSYLVETEDEEFRPIESTRLG